MAFQVTCDNCGKVLREKSPEVRPDAEPEKRVTLIMEIEGTGKRPIDMDLCIQCAKKYVGVLKEPI